MKLRTNIVFEKLNESQKRITSMRGGTRSGKTYNILSFFIVELLKQTGKTLTIARQTLPALKASSMRDFFEILENLNLYDENKHNKTRNEYELNGNLVEFIAVKESQRVRGRKRDWLFLNEANECELEAFRQLALRTSEKIVIDYNPSDAHSWIYDQVETRSDCELVTTCYKDNPFLEKSIVDEIERLKDADPDYWKVYGLGQVANISNIIFTHWQASDEIPSGRRAYGLDFGYNNPTALVEVTFYDNTLYLREVLYQTKLTTADLIERLKTFPELKGQTIYADSAEPKTIEEIARAGFKIEPAYKGVKDTINFIKSKPLRIDSNSTNLLREIKRYSWKTDKTGAATDEVVKFDDHLIDAARYGCWKFNSTPTVIYRQPTHFSQPSY